MARRARRRREERREQQEDVLGVLGSSSTDPSRAETSQRPLPVSSTSTLARRACPRPPAAPVTRQCFAACRRSRPAPAPRRRSPPRAVRPRRATGRAWPAPARGRSPARSAARADVVQPASASGRTGGEHGTARLLRPRRPDAAWGPDAARPARSPRSINSSQTGSATGPSASASSGCRPRRVAAPDGASASRSSTARTARGGPRHQAVEHRAGRGQDSARGS